MVSVIMLNVIMLSVVMFSVVVPSNQLSLLVNSIDDYCKLGT
jgi:hypothetical protein